MVKRPHQNMWRQLITLSKTDDDGLQVQLRKALAKLILERRISPEVPLPSSRDFACMLQISRSTVTLAYQQLVDEGYLVSRERQGYFINSDLTATLPLAHGPLGCGTGQAQDWQNRLKYRLMSQRNIHKPKDWYRYPYPFIFGQMDAGLLPVADWRECWRHAQSVRTMTEGGYDLLDQDDSSLVEQLLMRVLPQRGIWCRPENILITLGAQNALALIAKLLIKPTNVVGIENPGYPDARNLFELESDIIKLLDVDADGLVIDERLDECDYLYVTPSYQSPTTMTLSAARRIQLLEKAEKHDFIIIEDDYESEAAFGDEPIPALKSQDEHNRVIYCGSLSKSLAPGLRLGFLVADETLIQEARALRRLIIRHPPPLIESTVAYFIELGHYDSYLNRLSNAYRERWSIMAEAVDKWFPYTSRRCSFGGSSFWITGPEWLNTEELARSAAEQEGILIEPGAVHFGGPDPKRNCFRLGFSAIAKDKIAPGMLLLAQLIEKAESFSYRT
ncbi:MAG: PLP-dependent aminotransferase family protein [Pseudomonadales bacterium]